MSEFDANEAFSNANKGIIKKGYEQLRELIFDVFEKNAFLSDEENKAVTKDMLQTNTGVKYDNLVELWYKMWKLQRKATPSSYDNEKRV